MSWHLALLVDDPVVEEPSTSDGESSTEEVLALPSEVGLLESGALLSMLFPKTLI